MFNTQKLKDLCENFCTLDDTACERLETYGRLLVEWNEKMNLTAITDPEEIIIKHFYDCLLFFRHVALPEGASVIDVGTGAGFPGLVLKIARPDINLCLLDSLQKRITFLDEVLAQTGLSAKTVHGRAEECARKEEFRERYDVACARAVARLSVLSEYCLPYVKTGGLFVSLKGPAAAEEAAEATRAVSLLGGGETEIIEDALPDGSARGIIKIKKISQTPTKYPRNSGKISKQPL